jgi:hypothetical protein
MVPVKLWMLSSIIFVISVLAQDNTLPAPLCVPDTNAISSSSGLATGTVNEDAINAALSQVSVLLAASNLLNLKNDAISGLALGDLASFVNTAVAPIGLDKLCDSLSSVSENLGHMLDRYTIRGLQCSNDIRNIINSAMDCSNIDEGSDLVAQFMRPRAIEALQSTSYKINAQTLCLQSMLNDGK